MGGVQHFDQAVFELEALMQQTAQFLELDGNDFAIGTIAFVAAIIERQRHFSDDIQTRINLLSQLKATLIAEGLGLIGQLFVDLEMPRLNVIDQNLAEFLQWHAVIRQRLGRSAESTVGSNQLVTLLQPAIDQQIDPAPTLLSILTTFQHDDLSSLQGHAALYPPPDFLINLDARDGSDKAR